MNPMPCPGHIASSAWHDDFDHFKENLPTWDDVMALVFVHLKVGGDAAMATGLMAIAAEMRAMELVRIEQIKAIRETYS